MHTVDRDVVETPFAQLRAEARDRHAFELRAELGCEGEGRGIRHENRGCRGDRLFGGGSPCSRDVACSRGALGRPPGLEPLRVVDRGERPDRSVEGVRARGDGRAEPTGRLRPGIHLHLDDVARRDHARPGGRAGEDDVAGLEREVLRQVGHDLREREEEACGGVVLHELAVDPRAQAHRRGVDVPRVDQGGAERGEPVPAFRADVGALVVRPQIVEPEVVRSGEGCHVTPRGVRGHPARGLADDERDLALEGEEFGAGGPFDHRVRGGQGAGRLEEVRGGGGPAAALLGPRGVREVDRDDLSRPGAEGGEAGVGGGHEAPLRRI